jgi:hypothetical protein
MRAIINRFLAHPRWVMAVAVLIPAVLWADSLIFQLRRFGQPFRALSMTHAARWATSASIAATPGRPGCVGSMSL